MNCGVLAVVSDPGLRDEIDRIVAAAGLRVIHQPATDAVDRKAWTAAAAVIVDAPAVAGLTERALPRRAGTFLVCGTEPDGPGYAAAVAVGAQLLVQLPASATTLLRALADAGRTPATSEGRVLTVLSAHGGAGGSVFAAALALRSGDALLVDLDPFGGGIDRMLGIRSPGPRWADIAVAHGGLDFPSLRQVLPRVGGVSVLASGPEAPGSAAVEAVLDAGRRGGTTVVCDAVRTPGPSDIAVAGADLAVLWCAPRRSNGRRCGKRHRVR
ncbi:septum site-determining protein Ssd [Mycolicibacterium insubricum]|uniref:septum site-determining protein Ssd n=1 Tax=Mycolicibacterium insubricum TaxID=444597 RepID=UPI0021F3C2BF|nr:septum site-determining protein Ssd [Mycolicibacterium insubricum]MCV7082959.1 AAA family ATPase [Mycolicibacterium insubricum]